MTQLIPATIFFTLSACQVMAQQDSLKVYTIRAVDTDSRIDFNSDKHLAWFNTAAASRNTLLVFLCGTKGSPSNVTLFPALAANNGFHAVSLQYPNDLSATAACGNSADTNCHETFRREIIEGRDLSTRIEVNKPNSIANRLYRLLQYLDSLYPLQNWNQFFSTGGLNTEMMVFAGHSQGGGHAALIARGTRVKRVIMFAAPNDWLNNYQQPAIWTTKPHLTPDSAYFGFANRYDDIVPFDQQLIQWNALGLAAFGDTVCVNNSVPPYMGSHQLYTKERNNALLCGEHCNVITDKETPKTNGIPDYEPVWRYLLGLPWQIQPVQKFPFAEEHR